MPRALTILPLHGIPEVEAGADLSGVLCNALSAGRIMLAPGDVVVVAQKIVSKAEARARDLSRVVPSAEAVRLAAITGKDAAMVEAALSESAEVMRAKPNVLITRHRLGLVMANAGIDRSNVPGAVGENRALLLPEDPDASAATLHEALRARTGVDVGVIISDSFGRAWRKGVVGVAIGAAGVAALVDRRGEADREGRELQVTEVAHADAIAAAAVIVMGEGAESCPAVVVRGLPTFAGSESASALIRPLAEDMFR